MLEDGGGGRVLPVEADPDPGCSAFFTPGSGLEQDPQSGRENNPDPGYTTGIMFPRT